MKQTIIIHGATSFLGKNFLWSLIPDGYKIIIFSRISQDLSFIPESSNIVIHKYTSLEELFERDLAIDKNSFFYEFSWYGVFNDKRNDEEQFTINVPLIMNSIKLAKHCDSKQWIGIGSQAEYGNLDCKISESMRCKPTTMYGKSKLLCSQLAEELCIANNIEFTWLRLFSLYGPKDNHQWFVHYLVERLLNNDEIDMTMGEQKWDYLYIDDAIEILKKILMISQGLGIANYASGINITLKEFVLLAKELSNSKSIINFGKIPYRDDQVMNMEADISKISNLLDWKAKCNYSYGLKTIIEDYKNA